MLCRSSFFVTVLLRCFSPTTMLSPVISSPMALSLHRCTGFSGAAAISKRWSFGALQQSISLGKWRGLKGVIAAKQSGAPMAGMWITKLPRMPGAFPSLFLLPFLFNFDSARLQPFRLYLACRRAHPSSCLWTRLSFAFYIVLSEADFYRFCCALFVDRWDVMKGWGF